MSPMTFTPPTFEDGEQGRSKILNINRSNLLFTEATPGKLMFKQKLKLFKLLYMGIDCCIAWKQLGG